MKKYIQYTIKILICCFLILSCIQKKELKQAKAIKIIRKLVANKQINTGTKTYNFKSWSQLKKIDQDTRTIVGTVKGKVGFYNYDIPTEFTFKRIDNVWYLNGGRNKKSGMNFRNFNSFVANLYVEIK